MKLKKLTIHFSTNEEFLKDLKKDKNDDHSLSFDSMETFKSSLTQNRLEILMTIARIKPTSMYQMSKYLSREHSHVANDCKILEFLGFIFLEEVAEPKRQLIPRLVFDYDVIVVKDKIEKIFSISEKSNKYLMKSMMG